MSAMKNERVGKAVAFYTMTNPSQFNKLINEANHNDFAHQMLVDLHHALNQNSYPVSNELRDLFFSHRDVVRLVSRKLPSARSGEYRVNSFYDQQTQEHIQLNFDFTVTNGISNLDPFIIVVPNKNVNGIVSASSDVESGSLSIRRLGSGEHYHVGIINNEFSLYLPDGEYEVWLQNNYNSNEYAELSYVFIIDEGSVSPEHSPIVITVPDINVGGTLDVLSGPMDPYVSVQLMGPRHGYGIRVVNNEFKIHLPDGSYQITGYRIQNTEYIFTTPYHFDVLNGQINQEFISIQTQL